MLYFKLIIYTRYTYHLKIHGTCPIGIKYHIYAVIDTHQS